MEHLRLPVPGESYVRYDATRHNAGAWFVDLLAERLRAPL
ncbi:hypothetical protein ACUOFC_64725, partial [Escherichia sp. TWPC-MK]